MRNVEDFLEEKISQENGPAGREKRKKRNDRKGNTTQQRSKRRDSKVESNGSLEILDGGGQKTKG